MWWTRRSEYKFACRFCSASVSCRGPVTMVGVWQRKQPIPALATPVPNSCCPRSGVGENGTGCGRRQLAHEDREFQPVRQDMQRVVEALVPHVADIGTRDVVGLVIPWLQAGVSSVRCGEDVIGHAHFHVVGLGRKNRQGFVLRLPAETRNGAVVVAPVGNAADPQRSTQRRRGGCVAQDRHILNRLDQTQAEQLERECERRGCRCDIPFRNRWEEASRSYIQERRYRIFRLP